MRLDAQGAGPESPDPGAGAAGTRRAGLWRRVFLPANRSAIPTILCLPLAAVAGALAHFACKLWTDYYPDVARTYPELESLLPLFRTPMAIVSLCVVSGICACLLLLTSVLGLLFRRYWALWSIRKAYAAVYAWVLFYGAVVFNLTGQIEKVPDLETVAGKPVDAVLVFFLRYDYLWPAVLIASLLSVFYVTAWRRAAIDVYTGKREDGPAPGDVILENLRTHGNDPQYRKSSLTSVWSHLLIIVIIPWLLRMYGCVEPYKPPWGGGKAAVQMVRVKQVKKKKKRKKFILRTDAAIIFKVPDLDESKIIEEVEEMTQVRYVANASAAHGKLGDGDASTPGWQDGFKDGEVRFIRMEYQGSGWDDGMDAMTRADMNFLEKFRELSGGMKVSDHAESHAIHLLRKYPKGMAPPFVYMTGDRGISVSGRDCKIMRDYLMEGGMLFADCASPEWDRNFRGFIQQVLPGNPLIPIADDDPLFQIPFAFPNGAPPLWHHGGKQAMGVKCKGRWIVFYHPGDVNDAWKTGHSGLDPELAQGAFHLGVNVVYHSFMNYIRETRKYRK